MEMILSSSPEKKDDETPEPTLEWYVVNCVATVSNPTPRL